MAQEQCSISKDVDPNHSLLFGDNFTKKLQESAGVRLKLKQPKFKDWNSYQVGDGPKNGFDRGKNPATEKAKGPRGDREKKSTKESSN